MFAGPIISREVLTAPRPSRFYLARASYVGLLFILMWTTWQSLIGWRDVNEIGMIAFFGGILFRVFVLVQLTLILFFAPLASATAIAHEKDRRTFVLLLMTDLSDVEIVLGKLVASLLRIFTFLATGVPVFFLCLLLGGVSPEQAVDVLLITTAAGIAAGALGILVALGRDRTFQSLALTVLLLVLSIAAIEGVGYFFPELTILGTKITEVLNPYRAVISVTDIQGELATRIIRPSMVFLGLSMAASAILLATGVFMLRIWNPSRNEPREKPEGDEEAVGQLVEITEMSEQLLASRAAAVSNEDTAGISAAPRTEVEFNIDVTTGLHVPRRTHRRITRAPGKYRSAWDNPVIWRELKTRAYGAKPLIIKGAYILAFCLAVAFYYAPNEGASDPWRSAKTLIPIGILSLLLVNAQGVTSLTSERDIGALDLLLVTELSPKQFIYGKLYGVLYNCKEMVLLPVLLTIWFAATRAISWESASYVLIDFLLLCHFSAMLGIHSAITYTNSRSAVANSLGTIFFLMIGILVCAALIMMSDGEVGRQLLSFLVFIGAGSVALFASLGSRNPSRAIALVSLLTPFWTFYCIISLLNREILAAFLVSVGIYGFALLAMLVPAVSDFDIALGRTSAIQG